MRFFDEMLFAVNFLDRLCYYTGSTIIRKFGMLRRFVKRHGKVAAGTAKQKFVLLSDMSQTKRNHLQYKLQKNKENCISRWTEFKTKSLSEKLLGAFGYLYLKKNTIWNYATPVVAAVFLFACVQNIQSRTWALAVEYDGQTIGFIPQESTFIEADRQVRNRIINEEYKAPEKPNTRFTLISVEPQQLSDPFELSNQIIRASGNEIATASGLYVDDHFLGAVKEPEALLYTMDSLLEPYRAENPDAKVSFLNQIELKEGLYPVSGIVDFTKIEQLISSEVEGEVTYTVQSGDTPWGIANTTDTPYQQLLNLNPTIEKRLMPGQELVISNAKSFLDIKLTKTETYTEKIPFEVEQVNDAKALKGYKSVTKQGVAGEKEIEAQVVYVNGKVVDKIITGEKIVKKPQAQVVSVGTNVLSNASNSATAFSWPVYGRISAGWYGYSNHTAIDITGAYGTPIRAAAAGKVVMARNNYTGYGRYILIDHGSGVQTLYAHNSQLLVKVGDTVAQGQTIAKMGSTGNSSGNHCHFEVRINGRFVNPMKYLP